MEWLEADPLPAACYDCQEGDCYNCDHAAERWYLSREDDLRIRRKGLMKAIARLQKQVQAIDQQLKEQCEMSYDQFCTCLEACFQENNMELFFEICHQYPEYIEKLKWRLLM